VGSGAFLKDPAESWELARTMVALGDAHGIPTRALLTDMAVPLGRTVGNAVEVAESLEVLAGGGPPDVVELTVRLAAEMLELAGVDARDPADTLLDGTAMDRFRDIVAAQGGDLSRPLPVAANSETITAARGGTMGNIDALAVGLAVWRAGRAPVSAFSPVPGCGSTVARVNPSPRARCCSRSTATPRLASPVRWPNSTAPGASATLARVCVP
jgi:thymidine phosphorylase